MGSWRGVIEGIAQSGGDGAAPLGCDPRGQGGWARLVGGGAQEYGAARLVRAPRRKGGWTLLGEEVQQSYVDMETPAHLFFEYTRRVGSVIDAAFPEGEPIRVLHLGGGAFTLPRYIAATRPGSE